MGEPLPSADAVCEGGDLDCGSGLLLIIRQALEPLRSGGVLEVRSREISVREDLPAWCRMVGHALLASAPAEGRTTRYFVRKRALDPSLESDMERARSFRWKVRAGWPPPDGAAMQARVHVRNHSLAVGQPASFDTEDPAPSAVELLLSALGGCLVVGFAWRASRRGIELQRVELALEAGADNLLVFLGLEDEGHPGLARVEGTLYVDGELEDGALEELWRETLERSPVAQSLLRTVPLSIVAKRS